MRGIIVSSRVISCHDKSNSAKGLVEDRQSVGNLLSLFSAFKEKNVGISNSFSLFRVFLTIITVYSCPRSTNIFRRRIDIVVNEHVAIKNSSLLFSAREIIPFVWFVETRAGNAINISNRISRGPTRIAVHPRGLLINIDLLLCQYILTRIALMESSR